MLIVVRPRATHSSSSDAIPRKTLTIITVSASVGGFLLAILLYRLVRAFHRRATRNPLPPIQPLAHHRAQFQEHKIASASRPATWYDSNQQLSAPTVLTAKGSISSLTPTGEGESLGDVAQYPPLEHAPPLPRPPAAQSLIESPDAFFPITPHSYNSVHLRNSSPSPVRARPVSMGSIGAGSRRHSRPILRVQGAPHGPHSQIQVVMPSPLSMTLSPYSGNGGGSVRNSLVYERSNRFSLVDAWAPMPVRSTSSERRSCSFDRERRRSSSSLNSGQDHGRRYPSIPPSPQPYRSSPSTPAGQPPPVPRIPSIYNNTHTSSPDEQPQDPNYSPLPSPSPSSTSSPSMQSAQTAPEYPDPQLSADTLPETPQRALTPSSPRSPNSSQLGPTPIP